MLGFTAGVVFEPRGLPDGDRDILLAFAGDAVEVVVAAAQIVITPFAEHLQVLN